MNTISQVTMLNAEQVVNIKVEDIIEERLEESEALPAHIKTRLILLFHCDQCTVMELFPTTEKAGCMVTSSNDGRSWFHKSFFH